MAPSMRTARWGLGILVPVRPIRGMRPARVDDLRPALPAVSQLAPHQHRRAGVSGTLPWGPGSSPASSNPRLSARAAREHCKTVAAGDGVSKPRDTSEEVTGSVLGAIALITGSTVGAGMLALPATTVPSGFLPSSGVMALTWGFLILTALLMAEVNLTLMKRRTAEGGPTDVVVTQRQMAEETLGPMGAKVTSWVYPLLSYTLLVAYIAKGGEIVNYLSMETIPASVGGPVFSLLMAAVMFAGSTESVDMLNRTLTAGLVVLFGVLLSGGASVAQWDTLLQHQDWGQAWAAFPLIFMVLVFHDLIPVLCTYLGGDKTRVRTAILVGGFAPLMMYLSWDAVALALVPGAVEVVNAGGIIDPLRVLIESQGPATGVVIGAFSLLAVVTSFIGCMLGFSEYFRSELTQREHFSANSMEGKGREAPQGLQGVIDNRANKLAAIALAVAPPTVAAYVNPDLFYIATQIAGGYGMTLLYGLLPPLMAWQIRPTPGVHQQPSLKVPMVPGGRPILASVASCAAALEFGKLAGDSNGLLNGIVAASSQVADMVISDVASVESFLRM